VLSFNVETGLLEPSLTVFDEPPTVKTKIVLHILELLRLTRIERAGPESESDTAGVKTRSAKARESAANESNGTVTVTTPPVEGQIISATNLTILNLILVHVGPLHESTLCSALAGIQIASSALAFVIRYGIGSLVYGGDRR
jgi:UDP-N-acetylglucosamine--dolichyl-phosphate N-acetylglucosaminephosphotransferase